MRDLPVIRPDLLTDQNSNMEVLRWMDPILHVRVHRPPRIFERIIRMEFTGKIQSEHVWWILHARVDTAAAFRGTI